MACGLYAVGAVDRPISKVGISVDPRSRRVQIQNSCPFRVILGLYIMFPERWMVEPIEETFHGVYAKQQIHGEWFNMPLGDAEVRILLAVDFCLWQLSEEVRQELAHRKAISYHFLSGREFYWRP